MEPSLWIIMPLGSSHGWGICGKYLTLELMHLTRPSLITDDLESESTNNRAHYDKLCSIHLPLDQIRLRANNQAPVELHQPVLQTIAGANLKPWLLEVKAPQRIGYTFFERTRLDGVHVQEALRYFDWIAAGSSWCEKILRSHGVRQCSTIIQGVDPDWFHPGYAKKEQFHDQFVIFSGGKLEFRKGQDLVIRAVKILQDRHDDILFVNAWYNRWNESVRTMRYSPYVRFALPSGDYLKAVQRFLSANGLDPRRAVILPPVPQNRMAQVYRDTDLGLFPNRCEGGTNLVLMEYMACAKPVIASYCTGHEDVLDAKHSILIKRMNRLTLQDPSGKFLEQYDDPDLEEIIDHLEWAYQHPEQIKDLGVQAGRFMQTLTWQKAAKDFLKLLQVG